jgi:hypothetical protein
VWLCAKCYVVRVIVRIKGLQAEPIFGAPALSTKMTLTLFTGGQKCSSVRSHLLQLCLLRCQSRLILAIPTPEKTVTSAFVSITNHHPLGSHESASCPIPIRRQDRCVHPAYNPYFSARFFSRNSIFLSQQISQQCFSAGLSTQLNRASEWICPCSWIESMFI